MPTRSQESSTAESRNERYSHCEYWKNGRCGPFPPCICGPYACCPVGGLTVYGQSLCFHRLIPSLLYRSACTVTLLTWRSTVRWLSTLLSMRWHVSCPSLLIVVWGRCTNRKGGIVALSWVVTVRRGRTIIIAIVLLRRWALVVSGDTFSKSYSIPAYLYEKVI